VLHARPRSTHCYTQQWIVAVHGPGLQSHRRKFCSDLILGNGRHMTIGAATLQLPLTDSHREVLLTADCCHLPERCSQEFALPRVLPLVAAALLLAEIFGTDDISRACRCAALPDCARLACASPSPLPTPRCAHNIAGRPV
jgi:hypothetical protein